MYIKVCLYTNKRNTVMMDKQINLCLLNKYFWYNWHVCVEMKLFCCKIHFIYIKQSDRVFSL